jgi:hypothetical protein
MLYDNEALKNTMLDTLDNRVSSITSTIVSLLEEGYVPNKNKITIVDWSSILFHAYENIDVFSKEQHNKLDILYNKVLKL